MDDFCFFEEKKLQTNKVFVHFQGSFDFLKTFKDAKNAQNFRENASKIFTVP